MNYEEVETFLSIFQNGSIAKAAQALYISQGTASTRLQQLEEKLGVQLFYRQKGIREISLTPEGKNFLPIAQLWSVLWQDALHLSELQTYRELRIASTNMVNSYLFINIYKKFMYNHQDIVLTIQTHHSSKIHPLIENQLCDIGFVFTLYNYPNVISVPLYREDMVFIYHKNSCYAKTQNINDLKVENEIYLKWSNDFSIWHNQYFPYSKRKKITLGTAAMLPNFLGDEEIWSIVSMSLANELISNNTNLCCSAIDNPPPQRTAYILYHKYSRPGVKSAIQVFLKYVIEFIKKNDAVTLLYKQ